MASQVHFVRHAQGLHNLCKANHQIQDPGLTPLGVEQCRDLSIALSGIIEEVDLIVASPLRRTLYTALNAFDHVITSKGLKVIALPELQEISALPSDTGSTVQDLEKEFSSQSVDFSLLYEGWTDKSRGAMAAPDARSVLSRASTARKWLASRPEKNIAVVTHGGFLHYLTDDWTGIENLEAGTAWANIEFRSFHTPRLEDPECRLIETDRSRERRGAPKDVLSKSEQETLRDTVLSEWLKLGYIDSMQ